MRNKMKSKSELCIILDRNGKLGFDHKTLYRRAWMEHFMELLNVQTDSEDIKENSYIPENSNIPDKVKGKVVLLHSIEEQLGERRYNSYSFLTPALEGVSGQHHTPAALYTWGKSPWYPSCRRLGGPQSWSGRRG
jgi:hypothetical protein